MTSNFKVLEWRLAEAIAWCAFQSASDPNYNLRSTILQPVAVEDYTNTSSYPWEEAVQAVVTKRAKLLQENAVYPPGPAESLADGRLLLYYPDANLADGAAEVSSEGYFDFDNIPPWDTWLWFSQDHSPLDSEGAEVRDWNDSYHRILLSWVPPQFVSLADKGVWADPELCIR